MNATPLVITLAAALACGACGGQGTVTHTIPPSQHAARFIVVGNAPFAPIAIGSASGVIVSDDSGVHWRLLRPDLFGARAMTYSLNRALISIGASFDVRGMLFGGSIGIPRRFPFAVPVSALASDFFHLRIWAVSFQPRLSLYYSNDEGQHWFGLPAYGICRQPLAMAATGHRPVDSPSRLFVACGDQGIYVSDDLGMTFAPLAGSPPRVVDIATSVNDASRIVIATPVVEVSRDAGHTWKPTRLSARRVAIDPRNSDLVFVVASDGRLYESSDGGASF